MTWFGLGVLFALMYLMSSGAAFIATYKFPGRAPIRFFRWFYMPLDWLAARSPIFQRGYNGFHQWCYRLFVKG